MLDFSYFSPPFPSAKLCPTPDGFPRSVVLSILLLPILATFPAYGQTFEIPSEVDALAPASTGGAAAVDRALSRLSNHRRLLVIAAHPDDEDTFVLAHVAASGGEAAYLSLSRGDGGQNLIGSELGVGLGLLRSRELESARRVDGARQYFTRAFDFGYTRSLEETFRRWPEDELMADARRVIRRFKPQVLVAVFPADERAGHGQHQASAVVADRLYSESTEGTLPWSIDAFFRAAWWRPEEATLTVDLGRVDPFTGRSTFQTALASRSRHRCQDMGFEQPPGDAQGRLIEQRLAGREPAEEIFARSDTRLAAMAAPLLEHPAGEALGREVAASLEEVQALAEGARSALVPSRLGASVPPLVEIVRRLADLVQRTDPASAPGLDPETAERRAIVHELLVEKLVVAREGLSAAAGIVADAITDRERIVPGEALAVRTLFWNTGDAPVEDLQVELLADHARMTGSASAEPLEGRFRVEVTDERLLQVRLDADAELSAPYFLRRPRDGDLYHWRDEDSAVHTLPFAPPPLRVRFRGRLHGVDLEWTREVVHRYRDQAVGEVRRPLQVVPALEVSVDRDLVVRPSGRREALPLRVELTRHREEPLAGELRVRVPEGWPQPDPVPFTLDGARGQRLGIDLAVDVPADLAAGRYEISVTVDGEEGRSLRPIEYEHIRPVALPERARVAIHAAPMTLPDVERVAYLRGASDRVPEMLAEVGLPLELVTAEDLLLGDLDRFDTIVVGSRAFEIEPLLAKANDRLLDFARDGGTVVVQYQQYQYVEGGFAPYALEIRRPHDRVTDETAVVRRLVPEHPFFHAPNVLGDDDWRGWVQERGLYFGGTWDPAWTPLLAMSDPIGDPGGDEKHGALLVADIGKGRYVYTGLAFFRQLPAGVVGAYRLFLNLLTVKE